MTIWSLCEGTKKIQALDVEPWRVVEAQHLLSSRDIVDTAQEHDILEHLIEESKPAIKTDKNYLIFTPFRYPPLKFGSRFGHVFEPSLWYGSLEVETAFAEVAYYRGLFINSSEADLDYVELLLTAFQTTLKTDNGINLSSPPFHDYTYQLSDPNSYEHSQAIGTAMRAANVEAFVYHSARTNHPSKNIGAFTPDVFHKKNNQYAYNQQTWNCIANRSFIEFTRMGFTHKSRLTFLNASPLFRRNQ